MNKQRSQLKTKFFRLSNKRRKLLTVFFLTVLVWLAAVNKIDGQEPDRVTITPHDGETELLVGETIDRENPGNPPIEQNNYFRVMVKTGELFRVRIELAPESSDVVVVRVTDTEANILTVREFDKEKNRIITYATAAKKNGKYSVEVTCYGKTHYKITLLERRLATKKEASIAPDALDAQFRDAETERAEAIKKAEFFTDRMRPNAAGQPLNWADETDRREIVRRFAEGAKWWHIAGDHVKEFDALGEVVSGYQALKNLPAALDALNLALAAALDANRSMLKFAVLNSLGQQYRLMNNERRAVEYFRESLLVLQSSKLRGEWLAQNQKDERAAQILKRYEKSSFSRAEILERQTTIDISEARVSVLTNQTISYQYLGALEKAAESGEQTLIEARRAAQTGVSAYGYGEVFKFARRAAQLQIDAGNRTRAAQLIEEELTRAAGNLALEKDLRELLNLIESGSKNLKGNDNW